MVLIKRICVNRECKKEVCIEGTKGYICDTRKPKQFRCLGCAYAFAFEHKTFCITCAEFEESCKCKEEERRWLPPL